MSLRHCAATTAPRNCCPNCYAELSHKDNVRSSAVGKPPKRKKSNSQAQFHLPALELFWASFFLRVQLTSLFLISPGLCSAFVRVGSPLNPTQFWGSPLITAVDRISHLGAKRFGGWIRQQGKCTMSSVSNSHLLLSYWPVCFAGGKLSSAWTAWLTWGRENGA